MMYESLFVHPDLKDQVKTEYTIEYTDKDENIKDDFSNVHKVKCIGLESMINCMFKLRQAGKYNINLYTMVELNGHWIIEDSSNQCEIYSANETEKRLNKKAEKMEKTITELEQELALYKEFIKKYNAEKTFNEYKKNKTYTYYFRLRSPGLGCQPKEGLLDIKDEKIVYNNREYWGIAIYNRELTDIELYDYDLDRAS